MRTFLFSLILGTVMFFTVPASAFDLSCEGIWGEATWVSCANDNRRDQHSGDHEGSDSGSGDSDSGSGGGGGDDGGEGEGDGHSHGQGHGPGHSHGEGHGPGHGHGHSGDHS